jgi:hypothetical protein
MRSSAFVRLFSLALAGSAALVACGGDDDDTPAPSISKSGEGESCTRSDDCERGLACFDNVCAEDPSAPANGGSSGTGGTGGTGGSSGKGGTSSGKGGTGATGGTASTPVVLSGEGESCTRTADCEAELSCFNQRCATSPDEGDAGDGNVPTTPVLGAEGETCVLSTDCASGLVCRPSSGINGGAVGVCTPVNSEIEPTGKICGAECLAPADCCELPTELHATIAAKSCTELADLITVNAVDCSAPGAGTESEWCFAQATYCGNCAAKWRCTSGACNYQADCSADGRVPGGCPDLSRAGRPLVSTCDLDTEKCRAPAVDAYCDADADCDMQAVTDDPGDTCVEGECACVQAMCLRKCNKDLDCAAGKVCGDDDVCVPAGSCEDNDDCIRQTGDYRSVCQESVCTLGCEYDVDCNALTDGQLQMVCNGDGLCEELGCASDDECFKTDDPANNQRRLFCTDRPEGGTAATPSSAITD